MLHCVSKVPTFVTPMWVSALGETRMPSSSGKGIRLGSWMTTLKPADSAKSPMYSSCSKLNVMASPSNYVAITYDCFGLNNLTKKLYKSRRCFSL